MQSIWGTGIYTDDSSICNAAVHLGLLTYSNGGKVEYQIVPGQSSYASSSANGVTSEDYGSWEGSFILPAAPPTAGAVSVGLESWGRTAAEFAGQQGKRFAVACSGKGEPRTIWGANFYTSDSSICTAAVHVGLISIATGGIIQIAPGQAAYKGATANGVTSSSYDSWTSSFILPQDQTPP